MIRFEFQTTAPVWQKFLKRAKMLFFLSYIQILSLYTGYIRKTFL